MQMVKPDPAMPPPDACVTLDSASVDAIMPLHLRVRDPGTITHSGPTFAKLAGSADLVGANLFDLMCFTRPAGLQDWAGLLGSANARMAVKLACMPKHKLKAICVPFNSGSEALLNFSLGAGVQEIVTNKHLKSRDFSPADPTGEMLYMMEVQSMLLGASQDLNDRLNGAKMRAEQQAYTDSLTGLSNRRALRSFLRRQIERAALSKVCLLQIDLDLFKAVNDTFGHAAGDYVLQTVARVLQSETRGTDLVARIGGDEFVVVLSDYGTPENLRVFAHRIIERIREPIRIGTHVARVGASIGAVIPANNSSQNADELLRIADDALYVSKKKGGQSFSLASGAE